MRLKKYKGRIYTPVEQRNWPPEPTAEEFMTQVEQDKRMDLDELQYIYFLRIGVREYLQTHTPRQIKENWPEIRREILTRHGYLQSDA